MLSNPEDVRASRSNKSAFTWATGPARIVHALPFVMHRPGPHVLECNSPLWILVTRMENGLFSLLKGVLLEPREYFTDISKRVGFAHAVAIVAIAGCMQGLPRVLGTPHAEPSGAALMLGISLVYAFVMWFTIGGVAYVGARYILGGTGSWRETILAAGIAEAITIIGGLLSTIFALTGAGESLLPALFFGWYVVVLLFALREIHELSTARAFYSLLIVAVVAGGIWLTQALAEWCATPHLTGNPFKPVGSSWTDAAVPPNAENVLRNPGFETARTLDGKLQEDLPETWVPTGFPVAQRISERDKIVLREFIFDRKRDATRGHTGGASGTVEHVGAPLGQPVAWGWAQEVYSASYMSGLRKNAEAQEGDRKKQSLEAVDALQSERTVIAFEPAETLYLSLWLRGEDVTSACAFGLVGSPGKKESIGAVFSEQLTGTFDWREVRLPIKVTPDAGGVAVGGLLWGGGKLWMDDARLLRAPPKGRKEQEPKDQSEKTGDAKEAREAPATPSKED
jgi:hypothetical protein